MDNPKIRSDINAFPVSVEGKAMICFQDSLNLSQGVLISQGLFAGICSLLDRLGAEWKKPAIEEIKPPTVLLRHALESRSAPEKNGTWTLLSRESY